MASRPVRVLIIDDSPFTRKVFTEMLSRNPEIEVVGIAHDSGEGLQKVRELEPDVVTLDLFMPEGGGLVFLEKQMRRSPLPVVVVSSAQETDQRVLSALELGAVDFVQKESSLANDSIYSIGDRLAEKVIAAAGMKIEKLAIPLASANGDKPMPEVRPPRNFDAVVLGISTGGPQALRYLLPRFPRELPVPLAVVLHMPAGYTAQFAEKLNQISRIEVLEAADGLEMRPGRAILARGGYNMVFEREKSGAVIVRLGLQPEEGIHRPSVDVLFRSASEVYGSRLLAVVMTGMGSDGTWGAGWIKSKGGTVYAESEETSIIYGMPRSVVEAGLADRIVPLDHMAEVVMETL